MNIMTKTNKNPLVSIYIPSKDYGMFLEKSIKSVIAQLYTKWELFIVDEGSKDNTKEIAKKFGAV